MFSRAFSKIGLLLAVFAAVFMTACGGGGGSINDGQNPLHVTLNESRMSYGPIRAEIFGGSPPFYIRTNSSSIVFPEKSDSRTVYGFVYPTCDDGTGVITVWDDLRGSPIYGVRASFESIGIPFEPSSLTVTAGPGASDCTAGTSGAYDQICAGSQGVANLQLNPNDPYSTNQWVQFSVALGDFEIRNTATASWGTSAVTTTDSLGSAQVAIRAKPDAQTQIARIRAEVAGGASIETSFVIIGASFRMLPTSASWTSTGTTCPSRTASFSLYGGTPPYSVTTSLGSVSPSSVAASGGSVVLTVAACGTGELAARDAVGNDARAAISYTATPATEPEPEPPPAPPIVITPVGSWGTSAAGGRVSCAPNTIFNFTVAGGTPPYTGTYVSPMDLTTETIAGPVGRVTFDGTLALPAANTNVTVYVTDSDSKMGTRIIYCQ
ncbi:MAG: hypothetical protein LBI35_05705 [Burkholderiales bacterium]|nr:hypothetical protein [Burkholderiales bacterium]